MSTLTLEVPDVSCEHCRAAIAGEVSRLDGVDAVDVDLETRTVTVTGEPLDVRAIAAAIEDAGYEVAASR